MFDLSTLKELSGVYFDLSDAMAWNYQVDRQRQPALADVVLTESQKLEKIRVTSDEVALDGLAILLKTIRYDFRGRDYLATTRNLSIAAELGGFAAQDMFSALGSAKRGITPQSTNGLQKIYNIFQTKLEIAMPAPASLRPVHQHGLEHLARARYLIDS